MSDPEAEVAPPEIRSAEVVLPGTPMEESVEFFRDRIGFRLESIFPADDPAVAVLAGHGLRLRLERGAETGPGRLRLQRDAAIEPAQLVAPNGTVVELVGGAPDLALPANRPSLVVTRWADAHGWVAGRAGMRYRDLLPDRYGGRFIASHISIPDGGPVPDYVHYHRIRFQVIYCHRGWVRAVYEDQGSPFVMRAGDCVLQPPEIRHRVLEASPGLEVIEVGCPAEHETRVEHALELPNETLRPGREFSGQRFVRHVAEQCAWIPGPAAGWQQRGTGIAGATGGLAGVRVLRPCGVDALPATCHDGELHLRFVLDGGITLRCEGQAPEVLAAGDAFAVPAGMQHALELASVDLSLLEVSLPAAGGAG